MLCISWYFGPLKPLMLRMKHVKLLGHSSDFIWPFLWPYMGVIPNPKTAFIFPISFILALIFPILTKYFHKCEGKGSFLKSQIKSLHPKDTSCKPCNINLCRVLCNVTSGKPCDMQLNQLDRHLSQSEDFYL